VPDEITLLLLFGDRERARARLRWAAESRPWLIPVSGRDPILRGLVADDLPTDASRTSPRIPVPR
jgi:hypothetical protein